MAVRQRSNTIFFCIHSGKIVRRVKEETPGAQSRTNKNALVVWELKYDELEAKLAGIQVREHDYGSDWVLHLEDGPDKYQLSFPYSSGYALGFLCAIRNCDLGKPIIFVPWAKEYDGKTRTALYLYQQDNRKEKQVDWFYTTRQEETNKKELLPPLQKVKRKGKEQWDDSERLEFLHRMVETEILPKLWGEMTENTRAEEKEPDGLPF